MYDSLILFSRRTPPEGVDLFVFGNSSETGPLVYGIMRYYKEGSRLTMPYGENTYLAEERTLDAVVELDERLAPQDGYYFLDHTDGEKFVWLLSCIAPAGSAYGVLGPTENP